MESSGYKMQYEASWRKKKKKPNLTMKNNFNFYGFDNTPLA